MTNISRAKWAAGTVITLFLVGFAVDFLLYYFWGWKPARWIWLLCLIAFFVWSTRKGGWLHKRLWR